MVQSKKKHLRVRKLFVSRASLVLKLANNLFATGGARRCCWWGTLQLVVDSCSGSSCGYCLGWFYETLVICYRWGNKLILFRCLLQYLQFGRGAPQSLGGTTRAFAAAKIFLINNQIVQTGIKFNQFIIFIALIFFFCRRATMIICHVLKRISIGNRCSSGLLLSLGLRSS